MIRTIFALATPFGKSGVAIIRISGPQALDALRALGYEGDIEPRYVVHAKLFAVNNKKDLLDSSIVIYFQSPNSFTGEDVVELHTHGSIAVIKGILEELNKIPFLHPAEKGEFTKCAFINNKLNLIQVEALADLIDSESYIQKHTALRQFSNQLTSLYENWRQQLIKILVQLEAYIDFPEDDIPNSALNKANDIVQALIIDIERYLKNSESAQVLLHGVNVAIIGPPNSGKSSILNLLAKQDLAIVSDIAGTTRDIVQTKIEINGVNVVFYDTAGIRNTDDFIENEGIKRTKNAIKKSDINIIVFDMECDFDNIESIFQLIENNHTENVENNDVENCNSIFQNKLYICILNKIDIVKINNAFDSTLNGVLNSTCNKNNDDLKKRIEAQVLKYKKYLEKNKINVFKILPISAINEKYFSDIALCVSSIISEYRNNINEDELLITRMRQIDKLKECLYYLKEFNLNKYLELSAQDIKFAANNLSILSGDIALDDVLDQLFSSFCIGK